MKLKLTLFFILSLILITFTNEYKANLLLNQDLQFHAFENHRLGKKISYQSHSVAFWNTDAWGDIKVVRESHVDLHIRPEHTVHNMVCIAPGKKFWQFMTLPEVDLGHGDVVSLFVGAYQKDKNSLKAKIKLLKLDSEDGRWTPSDFGIKNSESYPKQSRGNLIVVKEKFATSKKTGLIELKIKNVKIPGKFKRSKKVGRSQDINTVAVRVEFENTSDSSNVWIFSPCLSSGKKALSNLPAKREMPQYYRHIPKTMQKLWKGEAIHILTMGSSIDRGSANPPIYLYDEDPKSKTFKQPIGNKHFDGKEVGREDLNDYTAWWQHYFSYTGRLRQELMRKYNLPVNKICLNYMACDGASIGESHSLIKEYCNLSLPPDEWLNGHKNGKTWQELHPELFTRPQGPGPDLIIFGTGGNESTDTPEEIAVYEGMIRWIQAHYPKAEFLFCLFQIKGDYSAGPGDIQALSLRYQIPYVDYGKVQDGLMRWVNRYALVPNWCHPTTPGHYIWSKTIEKAFECVDPMLPGISQLYMPDRIHPNSYVWEGNIVTYKEADKRIFNNKIFVLDETVVNSWVREGSKECWSGANKERPTPYIDGKKHLQGLFHCEIERDGRNSYFRHGNSRLGDRHILEFSGDSTVITRVDAKIPPNRNYISVESNKWNTKEIKVSDFNSTIGSPFGNKKTILKVGESLNIDLVGTDFSVVYADKKDGGKFKVIINNKDEVIVETNIPFIDISKNRYFLENRKGILNLGFGLHSIKIEAIENSVEILGIYSYDSRANKKAERKLVGKSVSGETIKFSRPFRNRPIVICSDGLKVKTIDITKNSVKFSGEGIGTYQIIGE